MGRNSIEKGIRDNWTVTPKRIAALRAAAPPKAPLPKSRPTPTVPAELYNTVLHDPRMRDPRGYVIPSDQPDFPTAMEFVK